MTLQAAASGAAVGWQATDPRGVEFDTGIHATLSGTGSRATLEYV